ncbi:hypothetical protein ES703_115030 [subsurface metagenome]
MSTRSVLLEKALESIGGREEFERKSRQYSESVQYIDTARRKLLEEYDDNWVAVYNSKVVAYGKRYPNVVKAIERKELPIGEVVLKFLSSRKVITLF